jgi:hypothetical protein
MLLLPRRLVPKRLLSALVLLAACTGAPADDKPADTDTADTDDTDDTDVEDTDTRPTDADGDAWFTPDDCDDGDASVNPDAPEVCDDADVDEDCDGAADEAGAQGESVFFADADGDGYAGGFDNLSACDPPEGYAAVGGDCSDRDPTVNPGATEVCDGDRMDEDCDGLVNEADPNAVLDDFWADADGDGYGDPDAPTPACEVPGGFVTNADDCDDRDRYTHPGGQEVCDAGGDEDCDGLVDDADPSMATDVLLTWYRDDDRDGWGDPERTVEACAEPSGYTLAASDCDDTDPGVLPGGVEICDDGKDGDCDGSPGPACGLSDETFSPSTGTGRVLGNTDTEVGYGWAVGDLEGDGVQELIVQDSLRTSFWLVSVRGTGDLTYADARTDLTGTGTIDRFGSLVIGDGHGDLDGDGLPELVLSVDDYESGGTRATYVFTDGVSAGDTVADAPVASACTYPAEALVIGDLDGDGYDDLGGVCDDVDTYAIFHGPLTAGTYDTADADTALTRANAYRADAGDLDGDGFDDLVLYDTTARYTGSWQATTEVFFGPVGDLNADEHADVWGALGSSYVFGTMQIAPDLDGDGTADLVLTAPSSSYSSVQAVHVPSSGSFSSADIVWSLMSDETSSYLGNEQITFGDFDGLDDATDVMLGAAYYGDGGEGAAFLFYGPHAGTEYVTAADVTFTGAANVDYAGWSVTSADLDGDGADDPIVGAPGDDGEAVGTGVLYLLAGGGF